MCGTSDANNVGAGELFPEFVEKRSVKDQWELRKDARKSGGSLQPLAPLARITR
jgi:hypothetical protein